jgi:hypothetical protein
MKKRRQKKTNNSTLKRIARAHAILSVGLFGLYLLLATIYSPAFLLSDIRSKFSALADSTITITAKVLAPPVMPVLSGSSNCSNNNLSVLISWPYDENTEEFEIKRDGITLMSGLTTNSYTDANVTIDASYTYTVIAYGSMGPGIATSNPLLIQTPTNCGNMLPTPKVVVSGIETKGATSPKTKNDSPLFWGTTNIPNAIITLSIQNSPPVFAQISANSTGYWKWKVTENLSDGPHTLNVQAKDPLDSSRIALTTFDFIVSPDSKKEKSSDKEKNDIKKNTPTVIKPENKTPEENILLSPIDFTLEIKKPNIYQGKKLSINLYLLDVDTPYQNTNAEVVYKIFNEKGDDLFLISESLVLNKNSQIIKEISIPSYIKEGTYKLQTTIHNQYFSLSKEDSFKVVRSPIINLGGGITMTYPQLVSKIGTTSVLISALFFLWLIIFWREYWLYAHSTKHITELNLKQIGSFETIKRKGVRR